MYWFHRVRFQNRHFGCLVVMTSASPGSSEKPPRL